MTPDQLRRLDALYDEADALGPAERGRFIDERCADDEEVRRELLAAFGADRSSGLTRLVERAAAAGVEAAWTGRRVGPYRIVRPIGHGGMGAVYLAVRDDAEFHKQVAIKTLKFELDGGSAVARFRHERQILAHLEHPNIARLLDGGTTEHGTPYIVLEYVDGVQIAEWCQQKRLTVDDRLRLFRQVCDAVQYAHQHLIVHRDIKPGNILVTSDGVPKLLDFGIAKLLDTEALAGFHTINTSGSMMTPDYVSPEQVRGEAVSTVTDVYSLGAVLYQLLTGERAHRLTHYDAVEVARVVCETEIAAPSSLGNRRLRGDLDTIVLKAMHKEPARRYSSVAGFSDDIRRHLEGLPITARPDTTLYRTAKFVHRHRFGVVAAAAVVMSLAIGAAVATREAIAARRADQTAQAVNDFLRTDLLAQASAANQLDPSARPDPDLKVRTALDRAASRIGGKFDRQPVVEAAIRDTIGQTYADLGIYPEARAQLSRALDLRQQSQGDDSPETLSTTSHLGLVASRQGKYPEAEALFTRALEKQRRIVGPEQPDTLYSMHGLATVYYSEGKYSQADTLGNQTLSIQRRVLGSEHPDVLRSMASLSTIYYLEGKYAEAQALGEQTLALDRRVRGPEHPDTISMMSNLAVDYFIVGKYAQSEALYREALELERRVLGPEHERTLNTIQNLANLYGVQGRYGESEQLFHETLEIQRRVLGPEHADTLHAMANLADAYYLLGKYADAEALFRETLDVMRRVLGPDHPRTLLVLADVAQMYQREGRYARAEAYASQALDGRRRVFGANHASTIASEADLALAEVSQGKFAESEALARDTLQFFRSKQPDDWQTFFAQSVLGASVAGLGRYAEAEPLLLDGYRGMLDRKDRIIVPYLYYLDRAGEWVVQLYERRGDRDQVAQWRARVSAARTDRLVTPQPAVR